MFKRFCLAVALLTGCRTKETPPAGPGTSLPLSYPVILIGQNTVDVRDDLTALTSASLAGGMNFMERKVVDSAGSIYEVKKATVVGNAKAWWRDMGTSQQRYFLELRKVRQAGLDAVKRLVLEQVEAPHSVWNGNAKAVARVRKFSSVADLIAGCRKSWEWTQ